MSLDDKIGLSETDSQEAQAPNIQSVETEISSSEYKESEPNGLNVYSEEIRISEKDNQLYEEILEKLDIKRIENNQNNQKLQEKKPLTSVNSDNIKMQSQVENALSQDFDKIQKLVKLGLINSNQGQNLKKQVLKKAFDKLVQNEKIKRALLPKKAQSLQKNANLNPKSNDVFDEFKNSNPDFFSSGGRKEVLNYLKSGKVHVGKDELDRISEIVRTVEKSAIDRYLQKAAHEKTLRNGNENAKQRLTANAQKSAFGSNLQRTFTREQIGKMSGPEFAKYESVIMEALKKGQIK